MKPVFTNVISDENYFTLVDGNKMINNGKNTKVFNIFFSNVIKNLKIPEYSKIDQLSKHTKGPVLKAIISNLFSQILTTVLYRQFFQGFKIG